MLRRIQPPKKELFETCPQNVKFKNGLAASLNVLRSLEEQKGNKEKATSYYKKAEEQWTELAQQSPEYLRLRDSPKCVQNKLVERWSQQR